MPIHLDALANLPDAVPSEEEVTPASGTPTRSMPTPAGPRFGTLTLMSGTNAGMVVTLTDNEVVVGRDPECSVYAEHPNVSRKHARILRDGAGYLLEDLGSRNGTTVRGQPVKGLHRLGDGDRVMLGRAVVLRFALADSMEEKELRRVYESAVRDALTGAFNRRYFEMRMFSEVAYAKRHGSPLSLLLLDLDHFKNVNDTHGHQAGDEVLRSFADLMQKNLRAEDVFVRYGGEEFAVIARGTNVSNATTFGERLRRVTQQTIVAWRDEGIALAVSIGVASLACCSGDVRPEALFAVADRRLYQAKEAGRNRVVGGL